MSAQVSTMYYNFGGADILDVKVILYFMPEEEWFSGLQTPRA